ncbi:cobyrinate a,c-diamide synthase [Halobellus limi]|uniref:Cobyrinate a,c-diamide synthase n=1 Tax=Halobellus limi TaxID=699433 RepID=A0A1H5YKK7_9EURY|nr:cobyrinate a,c-diamide synthase [Halobellus limi]QCC48416.1 cobyrinate a,c-diamide synthase [Halobellus limi]SEG24608.1 cobyrinic acid a,c-diamide synthase [Halobellus limi]
MTTDAVPSDLPGVVLAGTASGVGKTVATLAVCRALERAGRTPVAAKAGPDFIDPSHHAAVLDRPSRTLDPWLAGETGVRRAYARGADDGDVCVVEGMMGLYDGDVSTAAVAAALDLPVVLVVDASAGMESVAATALGFQQYAERAGYDVDVVGLLAARAHGGRHERGIRDAVEGLRYVGRTPRLDGLEIPDRHLGLHFGEESPVSEEALDSAARQIRTGVLLDLARRPRLDTSASLRADDETGVRVAVAADDAFRFVYPSTRDRLAARGSVETFSPVAGDSVPDCDVVYLPGGYPERHAAALSASATTDDLAARAADGLPIFGECGGMMALGESLTTTEGVEHAMAGVLPIETRMTDGPVALDHVGVRAREDNLIAPAGETRRGHEFHYSSGTAAPDARYAFEMVRGAGVDGANDGLVEYRTLGTYAHFHVGSDAFDYLLETV